MKSYRDLIVWQKGHQLVLKIYKATAHFPEIEKFGIVLQMRRAAVSITSNIAEGFSRISKKEKAQFYIISAASLMELDSQRIVSRDLGYVSPSEYTEIENQIIEVNKLTQSLIRSVRTSLTIA